ncbi:hypothetical protein HH310_14760 [Actinoplanes sp. TBRC 11911]|uniref:hypothetical protein n=1 Tax=Actinoplanes sp. TBRC 11911 TaxID=2729386 RepID=UPI00145DD104|nr:hypothetical protein [Actinoplanes sp. TBRC 11911]NMO52448.1 hypothetical protein [Actinoplanes sp. TBRC 11911]
MTASPGTVQPRGDETIKVTFDVTGKGEAAIVYTLGEKSVSLVAPIPWTRTVTVAAKESDLYLSLSALNIDRNKTVGCQIATSQLAMDGETATKPNTVTQCSVTVRDGR